MRCNRLLLASVLATTLAASFGASAAAVTYTIDPTHTVVLASWNHFGYSNPSARAARIRYPPSRLLLRNAVR